MQKQVDTNGASAVASPPRPGAAGAPASPEVRPRVAGKFLFAGDEKLYVRGVTYGTFRPAVDGSDYPPPCELEADFAQMADSGLNAVRTYTVPPRWLLDAAARHGLRVMVGLPWEQHVAFLDEDRADSIEERVREGVRTCAGHPAVLCYAIGNEIPASIVRWHGRRPVESFLKRLYHAAKEEDPQGLVTYVNYPSTEFLELPFLDLCCFNVYLEEQDRLEAYLARLHHQAAGKPLLMAEIGLDSRRNGQQEQAETLRWQIKTAAASGCAGSFVFAWTDEWHRGGYDIEDWDFGIVDRERRPKPALVAVKEAFSEVPCPPDSAWPLISVVVCTHNGERTLRDCFDGLERLDYPYYEVIVVDDGSTDGGAALAREYGYRLLRTPKRGLSSARNTGLEAATGDIVAYIDDDAWPDPHWLKYIAEAFARTDHVGIGGPNLPPAGNGAAADCIANSPGGPIHVLLTDTEAEHIPGCNMAFRRSALLEIGGFDERFRAAGDDVDVCWRLQERQWTLGFHPAALVWHHRRNSIRAYWKQQTGYGRAEALLEGKWPEKYNTAGHVTWAGRMYGGGRTRGLWKGRQRIHHGIWGTGLFQRLYSRPQGAFAMLPLMPEWYLFIAALAGLSALGLAWSPLLLALPLLVLAVSAGAVQAAVNAAAAEFPTPRSSRLADAGLRALTAFLYLLQPVARLRGRLAYGLTPWRRHELSPIALPRPRNGTFWSETWRAQSDWVQAVEAGLWSRGRSVLRGGDFDRWDLEVRIGMAGSTRLRLAVEEHGAGRQLVRVRWWPRWSLKACGFAALTALTAGAALLDGAPLVAAILGAGAAAVLLYSTLECAAATGAVLSIVLLETLPAERRRRRAPPLLDAAGDRVAADVGAVLVAETARARERAERKLDEYDTALRDAPRGGATTVTPAEERP